MPETTTYFDARSLGFLMVRDFHEEYRAEFLGDEVDALKQTALDLGKRLYDDHKILTIPVRLRVYISGSQNGLFLIYCRLPLAASDNEIPELLPRLKDVVAAMDISCSAPLLGE